MLNKTQNRRLELRLAFTPSATLPNFHYLVCYSLFLNNVDIWNYSRQIDMSNIPRYLHFEDMRWYFEDYNQWLFEPESARAKRIISVFSQLTDALYLQFIIDPALTQALDIQSQNGVKVEMIVILSKDSFIHSIPWELLCQRMNVPIIRSITDGLIENRLQSNLINTYFSDSDWHRDEISDEGELKPTLLFRPHLKILYVLASPKGEFIMNACRTAFTIGSLVRERERVGNFKFELLSPPTLENLTRRLSSESFDVVHLDGHGEFDSFHLEDSEGIQDKIPAKELGDIMENAKIRLLILDSCESGKVFNHNLQDTMIWNICKPNILDIIGMSHKIRSDLLNDFYIALYNSLLNGLGIAESISKARDMLANINITSMSEGSNKTRSDELNYSWIIPMHFGFHQSREIRLESSCQGSNDGNESRAACNLMKKSPNEVIGRDEELLVIDRILRKRSALLVYGLGGNGKSILVEYYSRWIKIGGKKDFSVIQIDLSRLEDLDQIIKAIEDELHIINTNQALSQPDLQNRFLILDNIDRLARFEVNKDKLTTLLVHVIKRYGELDYRLVITARSSAILNLLNIEIDQIATYELSGLKDCYFDELFDNILQTQLESMSPDRESVRDIFQQLKGNPFLLKKIIPYCSKCSYQLDNMIEEWINCERINCSNMEQLCIMTKLDLDIVLRNLNYSSMDVDSLRFYRSCVSLNQLIYHFEIEPAESSKVAKLFLDYGVANSISVLNNSFALDSNLILSLHPLFPCLLGKKYMLSFRMQQSSKSWLARRIEDSNRRRILCGSIISYSEIARTIISSYENRSRFNDNSRLFKYLRYDMVDQFITALRIREFALANRLLEIAVNLYIYDSNELLLAKIITVQYASIRSYCDSSSMNAVLKQNILFKIAYLMHLCGLNEIATELYETLYAEIENSTRNYLLVRFRKHLPNRTISTSLIAKAEGMLSYVSKGTYNPIVFTNKSLRYKNINGMDVLRSNGVRDPYEIYFHSCITLALLRENIGQKQSVNMLMKEAKRIAEIVRSDDPIAGKYYDYLLLIRDGEIAGKRFDWREALRLFEMAKDQLTSLYQGSELFNQSSFLNEQLRIIMNIANCLSNCTLLREELNLRVDNIQSELEYLVSSIGETEADEWLSKVNKIHLQPAIHTLGLLEAERDSRGAERLHKGSLMIAKNCNDKIGMAISLYELSKIALSDNRLEDAKQLLIESIANFDSTGNAIDRQMYLPLLLLYPILMEEGNGHLGLFYLNKLIDVCLRTNNNEILEIALSALKSNKV